MPTEKSIQLQSVAFQVSSRIRLRTRTSSPIIRQRAEAPDHPPETPQLPAPTHPSTQAAAPQSSTASPAPAPSETSVPSPSRPGKPSSSTPYDQTSTCPPSTHTHP